MICTRFLTTFLILFLFTMLPACSSSEEKKEKHYLRALEYIKISDDKAAMLELKNAVQLDAKYSDARYQLGLLYLKTGDPRGAFGELQRTYSINPNNLDAGVKVAEFHLLSQNKEESRKVVEQVLKTNPDYQDGLALLANLELIEGNFQKAEEAIDKAIKQSPDNDKFYNIKGRVLSTQGKWEEGEKLFQKAIELNPESFANYRTLLMQYEQRKDEAAIQKLIDIMTPKFPDDPQLQLLFADLYQKKGELDKTEEALLKAIEIKKDAIPIRLMLTDFYKKQRQFDKAEEVLRNGLVEIPDNVQLQAVLAELLFDLQKFTEARERMETILKTNPGNGAANLVKARFLIKDDKNNEAIDILTSLTNDYPRWADPFYYAALTNLRIGKIEMAQKAIEIALQNDPSNDRNHAFAAQLHLMRGSGADAGREAVTALRINKKNFIAVKLLAQALVLQKSFDKAIQFIDSIDKNLVLHDADLLGTSGMAYLGLKNKEKATESFTSLLELAPDNTKALSLLTALVAGNDLDKAIAFVTKHIGQHEAANHYIFLGSLYLKKQQNQEALQAFEKAQKLNPADPQGYILHARLLQLMGKSEESIAQYNKLLEAQPQSVVALMGLATTLESQGKTAEAMVKYKQLLEIQPDFPAAANNLAWLLVTEEQGDLGEALRLAMQAKQAMPDQANIADTLGWVYYKRESYGLAIFQFRHALDSRPDDPTIRFHLAQAQYANGEKAEAITLLKEIVGEETTFPEKDDAKTMLEKWQK